MEDETQGEMINFYIHIEHQFSIHQTFHPRIARTVFTEDLRNQARQSTNLIKRFMLSSTFQYLHFNQQIFNQILITQPHQNLSRLIDFVYQNLIVNLVYGDWSESETIVQSLNWGSSFREPYQFRAFKDPKVLQRLAYHQSSTYAPEFWQVLQ